MVGPPRRRRPAGTVLASAAAVLGLLVPAAASAAPRERHRHAHRHVARPVFSDPVAEAAARAVEYWGGTPCGGLVTIVSGSNSEAPAAGQNAPGAPGHVAAMWSEWTTPSGRNLFSQPPSTFRECFVHVNDGIWPSRQAEDNDFPAFCKEMLHEYGHFEGYPDVGAAPYTVEYERPDLARVPLCERYTLHFGQRLYRSPAPAGRRRRR